MSAPLANQGGDLATTLRLPPTPATEVLVRLDRGKQLQLGESALPADGIDERSRHSEGSEESRLHSDGGKILRYAQNDASRRSDANREALRGQQLFHVTPDCNGLLPLRDFGAFRGWKPGAAGAGQAAA